MKQMHDRRIDPRLLCADLVEVIWVDSSGRECRRVGNLEDISLCGMYVQLETRVHVGTAVRVLNGSTELVGEVRYSLFRDRAYFIGIQLGPDSHWSSEQFVPQHLLDPRELVHRALARRDGQSGSSLVH